MATLSSRDWIMAAVARLGASGIDAVKVEPLAAELGVSKGSFYWHFDNRDALLAGILDTWERLGTEAIIATVDRETVSAAERVRLLIDHTFGTPEFDGIELGIRAWARHDAHASSVVARVDARRRAYVVDLVESSGVERGEATARAELMYRTLIGEFVLRSHGAAPLAADTLEALATWMLRS